MNTKNDIMIVPFSFININILNVSIIQYKPLYRESDSVRRIINKDKLNLGTHIKVYEILD